MTQILEAMPPPLIAHDFRKVLSVPCYPENTRYKRNILLFRSPPKPSSPPPPAASNPPPTTTTTVVEDEITGDDGENYIVTEEMDIIDDSDGKFSIQCTTSD